VLARTSRAPASRAAAKSGAGLLAVVDPRRTGAKTPGVIPSSASWQTRRGARGAPTAGSGGREVRIARGIITSTEDRVAAVQLVSTLQMAPDKGDGW